MKVVFALRHFLRILLNHSSLESLYSLVGENAFFPWQKKPYINIGYWTPKTKDKGEAGDNLCGIIARAGKFSSSDVLLDVGCGYGTEDNYWRNKFKVRKIVGIDKIPRHIRRASQISRTGTFRVGNAARMPFKELSFTKVVALESAFHFNSRKKFFKEAYRVLKPKGKIIVADIVPLRRPSSVMDRIDIWFHYLFWHYPACNRYGIMKYERHLRDAGFKNIKVISVRKNTFGSFFQRVLGEIRKDSRKNTLAATTKFRTFLANHGIRVFRRKLLDYMIIVAKKS